jgi:hypothetical protein
LKFSYKLLICCCWLISISFIIFHVYFANPAFNNQARGHGWHFYDSIYRELWTTSICWIVFACHNLKSGGYFRSFLSSSLWQPFSKLCLSVYLIHFLYIELTMLNRTQNGKVDVWWEIHIHIGDIFMSLLFGTIFYLFVEAPAAQIILMMFKRNLTKTVEPNGVSFEKLR